MKVWWSIEDWCQGTPRPLPSAFYPLAFIYKHSATFSCLPVLNCFALCLCHFLCLFSFLSVPIFPPLQDSSFNCLCLFVSLPPFSFLSQSPLESVFEKQKWLNKDNSAITQTSVTTSGLNWSVAVKCLINNHHYHQWLLYSWGVLWVCAQQLLERSEMQKV